MATAWGRGGPGHPAALPLRHKAREGPGFVAMAATSSGLATGPSFSFLTFCPGKDARPWATLWPGCGHCIWSTLTDFSKTQSQRELDRAPTVLLASSLGLCPGCSSLALQHSTRATERIWMENEWPTTEFCKALYSHN